MIKIWSEIFISLILVHVVRIRYCTTVDKLGIICALQACNTHSINSSIGGFRSLDKSFLLK